MVDLPEPSGLVPGSVEILQYDQHGNVVRYWRDDGEGWLIDAEGEVDGIIEYEDRYLRIGKPTSAWDNIFSELYEVMPFTLTVVGVVAAVVSFTDATAPAFALWASIGMAVIGSGWSLIRRIRSGSWLFL